MDEGKMHYLVLLICIVVGLAIYGNSFNVPFLFDDSSNIQNPSLQIDDLSADSLLKAAVESNLFSRPVANISFAINYYFGEYNVRGYHLVNITIHIAASFFLYLLLRTTLLLPVNREKYGSHYLLPFLMTLLWLTHPLATQSVTYLVQRMNSLSAMFYILSILCYVQGRLNAERSNGRWQQKADVIIWFAVSLISGVLAMGAKEIAVTLPLLIFLYEWFFFQNLSLEWLRKKIPWIIALLVFLYFTAYFYLGGNPLQRVFNSCNNRPFTPVERVLTEFRVVVHYLGLLLYPHPSRLIFDYDFSLSTSLFSPVTTIFSLAFLLFLVFSVILLAKKERFIAFCLCWFLVNLVLESSVICLEIIFEHRTYLPSMFFLALLPACLYRIFPRKNIVASVFLLSALVFGYWTIERNKVWQNPVRFWQDTIDKQPLKARAYNNLATELVKEKKYSEAVVNLSQAIAILPDFPEAYSNLGLVQARLNRFDEAEKNFKKALALRSNYIEGRLNLAYLYKVMGRYDAALEQYRELYRQIPNYSVLNKEMGQVLLRMGQVEKSLSFLEKAYKKLPKDKYVLVDRGEAYMRSGKFEEAIKSYREVLDIEDGNPAANYNLGLLYTAVGKEEAALSHYRKVEMHQAVDVPVLYNLGNVYLRTGALEKARSSYESFIKNAYILADTYNNLGLVSIREGKLAEAMQDFQAALRINPDHRMAMQNLARVRQDLQKDEK